MEIEKLDNALEALLFVSGDGLKITDIAELLELQKTDVNAAIKRLKAKYNGDSGIHLITYNGKVQFASNPDFADVVSRVLNPIKEKALSSATLETIAIIAYKQPITRLELESIRGVNCDYVIQVLLKHNLIEVVGRKDVIGKPLLFGTTDEFLKRFQIESIKDLPDYEELLETIRVISTENDQQAETTGLYNEFELPAEEQVPEFLQNEQIEMIEVK
ncbi:MAG: SMC-Scp complex subunit ScpB [Clostridiales bacterium]|nr:SMC-Scp complex subunit ScpB [Clostridiales bacterium]